MAPPDEQGSGASPPAAAALTRQASCSSCTCSDSRDEPPPRQHDELRLSSAASFPSPASTDSLPAPSSSHKSSCESVPFADSEQEAGGGNGKLSPSLSSASSYESFFHIDADADECLDFEPPTRAPATQAMTAAQHKADGAYDPRRLPSAMFRTRSTNPAEWSVTSNDSLFSIQLSSSGDLGARLGDLYFDAAGFPRFPSMGSDASSHHSHLMRVTSSVASGTSGGLCLREDCARCSGAGAVRKSVRFAATESVVAAAGSNRSAGFHTAAPPAPSTKTPEAAAGWCQLGCCWPSMPTMWWPLCCAWHCYCCDCRC